MSAVLVLADEAQAASRLQPGEVLLPLATFGPDRNTRLQINVLRTKFLRDIPRRLEDLLYIAAFVYAADTRVTRGSEYDVFGNKWQRTFRMIIPVWDLDFWRADDVLQSLGQTLSFLTGDTFGFEFIQRTAAEAFQAFLRFDEPLDPVLYRATTVNLFSGGTDSLAAVLEAIRDGHRPLLVSHRPAPVISSRQHNIAQELRRRFSQWPFPHVSIWVHRVGGKRTVEFTQRSRAFLFTSLGVVAAALLDIDDVRLCDNGVVSVNLPQSGQSIGSLLSRSTHPRFLEHAEEVMQKITGRSTLRIRNTLLFKTKPEVLQIIRDSGHAELLQESVSCAHVEAKTKHQPHCGVCTQCIDRRFASLAVGMGDHDLASRYETDVFVQVLKDGMDRTRVENYVRFARRLEALEPPESLFAAFPEIVDTLPSMGDLDEFGRRLADVFRRHQSAVNGVVEQQLRARARDLRQGSLPPTCLLRIVASGEHLADPRVAYVERLRSLLCKSLPAFFQTHPARDEHHVQDAGDAAFQAAQERLAREAPQLPFGVINTKPDFSTVPLGTVPLFIEFKYPKSRTRLNQVVTEMTSRVTIYRQQAAWVLFVVYDPKRVIRDDDAFSEPFAAHEGIWVGIAR